MDKLHIVTVATESKYYFPYLVESCKRNGKELEVIGYGEKWEGFNWRFLKMMDYLKNIPSDDIVCFVDGYDVVCCKKLNHLMNDFLEIKKKTGCKIIVGCDNETQLPFFSYIIFGSCNHHFINAGTYIGYASDVLEVITKMYNLNPINSEDDQLLMTKYCQKNEKEIYIDAENKLFLSICSPLQELDNYVEIDKESGVLQYKSGEPYFIHANGFGYLDNVISKLGYTIKNDDIKNELFYNVIEQKVWHYTKDFFKKNFIMIILVIILLIFIIIYLNKSGYINNSLYKMYKKYKK